MSFYKLQINRYYKLNQKSVLLKYKEEENILNETISFKGQQWKANIQVKIKVNKTLQFISFWEPYLRCKFGIVISIMKEQFAHF